MIEYVWYDAVENEVFITTDESILTMYFIVGVAVGELELLGEL